MSSEKHTVTPMIAQFLEIKAQYENALLFYRMGDFYELFFADAVAASEALDIALTKRGKHLGQDIPMCGVPVHSAEGYLLTLIRKGFRVAVAEQMEDPKEAKKRGSKAVVRRDVVRLVTPGTLTEESLLDARRHNYLAAYTEVRDRAALAWVDISTGSFQVMPITPVRLGPELSRLAPREVVLIDGGSPEQTRIVEETGAATSYLGASAFDSKSSETRLKAVFNVNTLEAYGQFDRAELSAMGAIVEYLEITQKGNLPLLRPPAQERADEVMHIDAATRRNLELTQAMSGGRAGSLLAAVDRTVTAGGGRLLERRLSSPSKRIEKIVLRQDAIALFHQDAQLGNTLRDALRSVPDLERALSRLGIGRGGPRDLAAVRNALEQALHIGSQLAKENMPILIQEVLKDLSGHQELLDNLDQALISEPPLLARDGGFVATGFDPDLDEARSLRDEGRGVIAKMQGDYAEQTGISSLKIKHNNVLGYFIEVTSTHFDKMLSPPLNENFRHRQTTANQLRFTTPELTELESRILNAGARAIEIERQIFDRLSARILAHSATLAQTARSLSELDLSTGLADLARAEDWCRPVVDNSRALNITGGRHPVVELALKSQGGTPFIANDTDLGQGADIWLLTGPNMAGKSTFLRQNALITILAQMGSFVPAEQCHIGLVSQLFSRVGASDDLARGRSTFMVEMVETAAILNQADEHALVILDEIGRGTATYDGLSIAWATLEHLHDVNKCRTLFATHYHELTRLSERLEKVDNATVSVREYDGDIIFLHEVRRGAADRSYGVQVARLAGLPKTVVERARVVLEALEQGEREGGTAQKALIDDLPLFSATPPAAAPVVQESEVEEKLKDVMPDTLSPRQALDLIYELRDLIKSE